MLMKRFKPHIWRESHIVQAFLYLTAEKVSGCMFMFGLVSCLQGLTKNYSGLLAARFFLGESFLQYVFLIQLKHIQVFLKAECFLAAVTYWPCTPCVEL